jgi:hypothetical protein
LNRNTRDIVDESDENFNAKFELVYTMGCQEPIEFTPKGWIIVQRILDLLPQRAKQIKENVPDSIEFNDRLDGGYPRIRTLSEKATQLLLDKVAQHVCTYGFAGLPMARQPEKVRHDLQQYVSQESLTPDEIAAVEQGSFWEGEFKESLLLVRGLIAGGVLRFALSSKRWRVNYGIDTNRKPKCRLAVPFRSKDCPSPQSEFS